MKIQKFAIIIIVIMLAINTATNIYVANEIRKISGQTHYIMEDTLFIRNWICGT